MVTGDQTDVISFLSRPESYGLSGGVERIDTHTACVFLAGTHAYKLKRAVRYDYLDFSTRQQRREACERELLVNRRTAPNLYQAVRTITREASGALGFDGGGTPVDDVVQMLRFDQDALFDRLAARRGLSVELLETLARIVAAAHHRAPCRFDHGGSAGMQWVIDGNEEAFPGLADVLDRDLCREVTRRSRTSLHGLHALLEKRRVEGRVRECHGDLHLRNIVLLDGVPTLFDAVEFNDHISCVDVLYDVAFLIMDLLRLNLRAEANAFFNQYLWTAGELAALPTLPLFLSCRSAVRAKTSATGARLQSGPARAEELRAAARAYLNEAAELLTPVAPRLIAIGGLTGSGKSTLARSLAPDIAPAPGAVVARSDVIRKLLFHVAPETRLDAEAYAGEITRRVYRALNDTAVTALRAGHSVILDAVFANPDDRAAIEAVARSRRFAFRGIWLDAPFEIAADRIRARRADASDATVDVLKDQCMKAAGDISWTRLDGSVDAGSLAQRAQQAILGSDGVARPGRWGLTVQKNCTRRRTTPSRRRR